MAPVTKREGSYRIRRSLGHGRWSAAGAGRVKPLVGHSQSMDTFGIYGHALAGEDVETAEKINGLFQEILTPEKAAEK